MNADAVRIVSLGIDPTPGVMYVVSARLRTYLGVSRDGTYFHALRPARLDDPAVGDGKRVAGELVCSCAAGAFGRACYWTQLAAALEKGDVGFVIDRARVDGDPIPAWIHQAPGELTEIVGR